MGKPRVFVASSTERLEVARAIQDNLSDVARVKLWDQDVFKLSESGLRSLVRAVRRYDFGVFVCTADVVAERRGRREPMPCYNVIFELGLFMGCLGAERCYLVTPSGARLPTDLLGVTTARYDEDDAADDPHVALASACNRIRGCIRQRGPAEGRRREAAPRQPSAPPLPALPELLSAGGRPSSGLLPVRSFTFREIQVPMWAEALRIPHDEPAEESAPYALAIVDESIIRYDGVVLLTKGDSFRRLEDFLEALPAAGFAKTGRAHVVLSTRARSSGRTGSQLSVHFDFGKEPPRARLMASRGVTDNWATTLLAQTATFVRALPGVKDVAE